jgi:hypothetical protein
MDRGCQTPTVWGCQTPTVWGLPGLPDTHRFPRVARHPPFPTVWRGVARHPPFGEGLPDTRGCQTPTVWRVVARHPPFGEGNSNCSQSLGVRVSGTPVSRTPHVILGRVEGAMSFQPKSRRRNALQPPDCKSEMHLADRTDLCSQPGATSGLVADPPHSNNECKLRMIWTIVACNQVSDRSIIPSIPLKGFGGH